MKITDETIQKIEEIFGFPFYDWQKEYLKGERTSRMGGRSKGNTFAYCLKFLLSDGEKVQKKEVYKYWDGYHGARYPRWFQGYCLEINQKLIENGFETRILD
ncbi:MAG: hypothetical protein OSJ73_19485 [Lachnospiraceae bacterium]|nr:hypothetical protein [Lachnospiraceae bacterium]